MAYILHSFNSKSSSIEAFVFLQFQQAYVSCKLEILFIHETQLCDNG